MADYRESWPDGCRDSHSYEKDCSERDNHIKSQKARVKTFYVIHEKPWITWPIVIVEKWHINGLGEKEYIESIEYRPDGESFR